MITKNTLIKGMAGFAGAASLLMGFALPVSAQTANLNIDVSAKLPSIISKSDAAINVRLTSLNKLSTRIGEMKNVSASEKATVSSEVSSEISSLTALKAKIDSDTDVTVARQDEKTITGDYRIYMLVIPQGYILAGADRIATISSLMTDMQAKLQARVSADQSAGKDTVQLQASLSDMSAKIAAAVSAGQSAKAVVSGLVPDKGNTTVEASNKAALVSGKSDIKSGETNLKAAREDISVVMKGLVSLK